MTAGTTTPQSGTQSRPAALGCLSAPAEDGQVAYERGDHATAVRLWRPLDPGDADAQYGLGRVYFHVAVRTGSDEAESEAMSSALWWVNPDER